MKTLVLTFGMVLILSFTASQTDTSSGYIPETYNLIKATGNLAKPGCNTTCGDLIVPYPFGIGLDSNCSIGKGFDVYCNTSFKPHKAFFIENDQYDWVKNISDFTVRTSSRVASRCYYPNGTINALNISYNYLNRPYTFSPINKFTALGCNEYALLISATASGDQLSTGCMVFCSNDNSHNTSRYGCWGNSCCQSSIPPDMSYYATTLQQLPDPVEKNSPEHCTYAYVGEDTFWVKGAGDLLDPSFGKRVVDVIPLVLDWAIGNLTCAVANETEGYACQSNSICVDSRRESSGGYLCQCNPGYEGNPYLSPGCQDINECIQRSRDCNNFSTLDVSLTGYRECMQRSHNCDGNGVCINTPGSYLCRRRSKAYLIILAYPISFMLGVFLGTVILFLAVLMYRFVHKRKDKDRREKFFKRNGGLLLQQQTSNGEDAFQSTRMFSARELEKATDKYNTNRIVGRGGQGTVYKGMLPDGKIVAVKKSMLVDEAQVESFINEVFLLSQISHRNVVKLLGCCLETEVPILVYEFVSNGDLFQFIHDENYEFPTLWSIRLIIATEVAGALAYMHSATSVPIYHRDIKSSNILLDEKFRAKLSDFGISKSVMGDKTHLSTLVKGTYGYLDPEYCQSNQFTEKSDVYSFGIVLVELLTGKKPIYSIGPGESRSLATLILSMEEELILENIDNRVSDGPKEQFIAVAKLAKRCLIFNGKLRPTMKEVATELEGLRSANHSKAITSKPISGLVCRSLNQVGGNRPSMKQMTMKHTNLVSEDNYNETTSLNMETEPSEFYTIPLIPKSDTFEDSSITSEMQDMMLQLKSAR